MQNFPFSCGDFHVQFFSWLCSEKEHFVSKIVVSTMHASIKISKLQCKNCHFSTLWLFVHLDFIVNARKWIAFRCFCWIRIWIWNLRIEWNTLTFRQMLLSITRSLHSSHLSIGSKLCSEAKNNKQLNLTKFQRQNTIWISV